MSFVERIPARKRNKTDLDATRRGAAAGPGSVAGIAWRRPEVAGTAFGSDAGARTGAFAGRRHTSPPGRVSSALLCTCLLLCRVSERLAAQDGALPIGRASPLRAARNIDGLAERGEKSGDALRLGDHGDELHPSFARRALEQVERKRAAKEVGAAWRRRDSRPACVSARARRPPSRSLPASQGAVRCGSSKDLRARGPRRTLRCESAAAGHWPRVGTGARADPCRPRPSRRHKRA